MPLDGHLGARDIGVEADAGSTRIRLVREDCRVAVLGLDANQIPDCDGTARRRPVGDLGSTCFKLLGCKALLEDALEHDRLIRCGTPRLRPDRCQLRLEVELGTVVASRGVLRTASWRPMVLDELDEESALFGHGVVGLLALEAMLAHLTCGGTVTVR